MAGRNTKKKPAPGFKYGRQLLGVVLVVAAVACVTSLATHDADDPTAPNNSMPNYIWTTLAALMKLEVAEAE